MKRPRLFMHPTFGRLFVVLALLQLLDAVTTLVGLDAGATETNIVARFFLAHSEAAFVYSKVVGLAVFVGIYEAGAIGFDWMYRRASMKASSSKSAIDVARDYALSAWAVFYPFAFFVLSVVSIQNALLATTLSGGAWGPLYIATLLIVVSSFVWLGHFIAVRDAQTKRGKSDDSSKGSPTT